MLVPIKQANSNATYSSFIEHFYSKPFLSKLINVMLYRADLSALFSEDVYNNVSNFVKSIRVDLKNDEYLEIPKKHITSTLNLMEQLVDLKSDQSFITVSYDNFYDHYKISDSFTKDLIDSVITNPIANIVDLKDAVDDIQLNIRSYSQIQIIRNTVSKWDNFIKNTENNDNLTENSSALNWIKAFKNTVDEAFTNINETIGVSVIERETNKIDYTGVGSVKDALKDVFGALKESYRTFKTGYDVIDINLGGLESSNVTIISGDSNHGKSLFATNVFCSMIKEYVKTNPSEDDAFFIMTLEDDIVKLNRRITSIAGNYDNKPVKALYDKYSTLIQSNNVDDGAFARLEELFDTVTDGAIYKNTTQRKVSLYVRHGSESHHSMNDIARIIDSIQTEGKKVRAILIDYVDMLIPSNAAKANTDDYNAHGEIIKEMRAFARKYGIAVLTITQNKRAGEGVEFTLSNNQIGDSYKKIRYADNVIMIRRRNDMPFLDQNIDNDIQGKAVLNVSDPMINSMLNHCVPFEVKITKAKNGSVDKGKYHIFNTMNLKIYDTAKEALDDYKQCITQSNSLRDQVDLIELSSMNDIEYSDDSIF